MTVRPDLPLEVLGLLGPILSWTEGVQKQALPKAWNRESVGSDPWFRQAIGSEDTTTSLQERGWLLQELPTYSLDNVAEVVAYAKDQAAPPTSGRWALELSRVSPPLGFDLCKVFDKLVERYLRWIGGEVSVRADRMVELHELGLRLPLSLVLRHVHARAVVAEPHGLETVHQLPESMSLLPSGAQGMRAVVRRGLTEGHLHLSSVYATEISWADQLLQPTVRRPRKFAIVEWRLLRLGRAAARLLALATALCRGELEPEEKSSWVGEAGSWLLRQFDAMYFAGSDEEMFRGYRGFKNKLEGELQHLVSPAKLRKLERWPRRRDRPRPRRLQGTPHDPYEERLGFLYWLDPSRRTHHWQASGAQTAYPPLKTAYERDERLAALHLAAHIELVKFSQRVRGEREALAYPTMAGQFLHNAFYRYLVCQSHFWQLGVQQGRTTGLRHFRWFFDSNQRRPIEPTDREKADSILRRTRSWRGLRVLEGRVSPPKGSRELEPWIEEFAAPDRPRQLQKFGLVVHFIKEEEAPRKEGRISSLRPRFAELRSRYRSEAFNLFRVLEHPLPVTPFIVGIDAANLELATPPEVFAPVFRFLRQEPIALRDPETVDPEIRRLSSAIRALAEKRRLGMTYHVGEEFRHLLSGLRAIDEVLEFLGARPGDRIGHGIALGLNPETWMRQVGAQALVPKQEWLDNMAWVYQLLGPGDDLMGVLGVEQEIERLGGELYAEKDGQRRVITPLQMHDVWKLRQLDPEFLVFPADEKDNRRANSTLKSKPLPGDDSPTWRWNRTTKRRVDQVCEEVGCNPPYDYLQRYWYSMRTYKEGNKPKLIDMEDNRDLWIELCQRVQREMQRRIAERQIVVEVNPSANRIIGPMGSLAEHHIFDLTVDKDSEKPTWNRRIRVSVNTDNPGTANTSLTHEYYLLGEAMLKRGFPEPEVVDWLEWLRATGEESSFVQQLPGRADRNMGRLLKYFEDRRHRPREFRDPDACLYYLWQTWPRRPGGEPRCEVCGARQHPRRCCVCNQTENSTTH